MGAVSLLAAAAMLSRCARMRPAAGPHVGALPFDDPTSFGEGRRAGRATRLLRPQGRIPV